MKGKHPPPSHESEHLAFSWAGEGCGPLRGWESCWRKWVTGTGPGGFIAPPYFRLTLAGPNLGYNVNKSLPRLTPGFCLTQYPFELQAQTHSPSLPQVSVLTLLSGMGHVNKLLNIRIHSRGPPVLLSLTRIKEAFQWVSHH